MLISLGKMIQLPLIIQLLLVMSSFFFKQPRQWVDDFSMSSRVPGPSRWRRGPPARAGMQVWCEHWQPYATLTMTSPRLCFPVNRNPLRFVVGFLLILLVVKLWLFLDIFWLIMEIAVVFSLHTFSAGWWMRLWSMWKIWGFPEIAVPPKHHKNDDF